MIPDLTPSNNQFFLQDVHISLPLFYLPTLCGWYEGNHCWKPVHFTLGHRLSATIFHPVGVTPNIAKLNLTMPEGTNHLFCKITYKWMPPKLSFPTTPNTTFLSHPLYRHTLRQPYKTAQAGPIAFISVGRAAEVDCEAEVDRVAKRKNSAALPTPPLPHSFQH